VCKNQKKSVILHYSWAVSILQNFAHRERDRERERQRRNCEVLQENFSVKWRCMEGCNLPPGLGRYTTVQVQILQHMSVK
jgi:hypothetical protein